MSTLDVFSGENTRRWYLTGLVEGAGSFTFSRCGRQLMLAFAIRSASANRRVLESLRELFRAGQIYDSASGAYYRINRPRELLRVVEHFDRYPLQGEKRNAYKIWREMVLLRLTHHGSRTPDQLQHLAKQLTQTKKANQKNKPH